MAIGNIEAVKKVSEDYPIELDEAFRQWISKVTTTNVVEIRTDTPDPTPHSQ